MIATSDRVESSQRRSLGETAYATIYRKIITLDYEPGMHLEESHLVEALGIGRTPIREALQKLATDLLVESQPGKGFIVRPLTLQNTKAAFSALQILELGVAGLAVRGDAAPFLDAMQSANDQVAAAVKQMDIYRLVEANSIFHDGYARCSHNAYLIQCLQKVRCETNRLAYLSYGNEMDPERSLKDHYASVIDQHDKMIKAIEHRDERQLKQIIVEHIKTFQNRIINYLMSF